VPYQLVNLRVNNIIMHEIYKRGVTDGLVAPKFSSVCTSFDQSGLDTFQSRVTVALGKDSHCIEMVINQNGSDSAYAICSQIIDSNLESFISLSQKLTAKLAESQTSQNIPGGIILIFTGLVGNQNHKYVGIIKAELQGGFNREEVDSRLLLKYLSTLFLTPTQRLYKVAMFVEVSPCENSESRTPDDFNVLVFDHNMKSDETRQAAKYFYETFLGCGFSPSDRKLTSDFFNKTNTFIEDLRLSDEDRVDLKTSLYSYLKVSQRGTISIDSFSQEYLDPGLRDNYRNYMVQNGIPEREFNKDLTYIKNKLRKRNLKFTSKVNISAPSDDFETLVKIEGQREGRTVVSILGQLDNTD
jgi:hypothetical protein